MVRLGQSAHLAAWSLDIVQGLPQRMIDRLEWRRFLQLQVRIDGQPLRLSGCGREVVIEEVGLADPARRKHRKRTAWLGIDQPQVPLGQRRAAHFDIVKSLHRCRALL